MSLHLHMLQWFVDQIFCPAVVKESALTPIQVKMTIQIYYLYCWETTIGTYPYMHPSAKYKQRAESWNIMSLIHVLCCSTYIYVVYLLFIIF